MNVNCHAKKNTNRATLTQLETESMFPFLKFTPSKGMASQFQIILIAFKDKNSTVYWLLLMKS